MEENFEEVSVTETPVTEGEPSEGAEKTLKKAKKKGFVKGIIIGIVSAAVVLTIAFAVILYNETKAFENTISQLSVYKIADSLDTADNQLITQSFASKAELIYSGIIQEFYFDEDIDTDLMRDNMFKAIIDSLGDKYAEYYTAEELEDMMTDTEGVYYGIGSYVMLDETGYPILSGVFADSPAANAGLRDGDIITEVDGENLFGLTLTEAVNKIKGPENTDVELTVYREGESEYLHFTVTRGKVESPTVVYSMKDNDIGYLQITEFDDVTENQFKKAYEDLKSQGMKAMVLDLRSNGGGNLDTVLAIGEEMLPEGIITYTIDKAGNRVDYPCEGKTPIDIPLVVLTNGYTASASELLTGALHDYGLATVIGTNTYGKGIVQTIYPLSDGSGIKFTTSRYYTPNGVCIHETGIAPDIELEFDSEAYYSEEAIDNQLEYALEYLKGQIQ